ncbi:glycine/D-amino acid oxidase-like deaminating enzyme [Nitrosospira sp. Nsp2]|uniref:FAD-dependent oxidoreductase n=1 Tax=Nitrosospira sp. Nsp2 TaxID=136548 RepID=UPI000D2FFC66|nr:FAD-dependent oxidoreductase [Nitrosospira sp. Nsp2]PTR16196.1 glycine/D-amino acid oxidase-like deaminating enzyme [Nitrosospira sp. Nsp2]
MDTTSVWRATAPKAALPSLQGDIATDVVIVGGGITGVTLALNLAEQGIPAVLLEARDVGFGSTGNSTGNLYETVSRGIHRVVDRWDKDVAHAVTVARREAVDQIEHRVQKYGIGCGFRRCALYRYASSEEGKERVEKEYQGSLDAGLRVRWEPSLPPPVHPPHGQVMVLDNQAQFHPQAYVRELARQAAGHGCLIFEDSMVLEVDTDRRVVRTARGKVSAKHIVLATHSPKGLHLVQAEMVVNREYGLATRIERDGFPAGIFWGSGVDRISARELGVDDETYLICVGEEHKTGQEDANINLDRLEAAAAAHFQVRDIAFRWSAQNYAPADSLPYIGKDATGCFIATGFETDGLTWGTVAASIITDEIIGRDNLFAPLVKPSRFSPVKGAKGLVEENVAVLKSFVKDYVTDRPGIPLSQLMPGKGDIVKVAGESLAAYMDPNGNLLLVSPVCTHMKCKVHWNSVEKSWDCPCHGSRFAPDGTVIEGPATEPLQRHFLQDVE